MFSDDQPDDYFDDFDGSPDGPYSPFTGPDSYDRNGAWDGFRVTSDADNGL